MRREAKRRAIPVKHEVCGHRTGIRIPFNGRDAAMATLWWRHGRVQYRAIARRSLRVAAVVGTVLFFINQAGAVMHGQMTPSIAMKIGLGYLVPFGVASYTALHSAQLREHNISSRRCTDSLNISHRRRKTATVRRADAPPRMRISPQARSIRIRQTCVARENGRWARQQHEQVSRYCSTRNKDESFPEQ